MKLRYRIVQLNSGRYAIEKKMSVLGYSPFGWELVCAPHPECANLVATFNTIEDARAYFIDPMSVKRVIEDIPTEATV